MKKVLALMLSFLLLVPVIAFPVNAEASSTTVEWLEDGSRIETTIVVQDSRAAGTKTASKIQRRIDNSGNVDVEMTLTATFTYDGTTAKATSASVSATIYDSSWSVDYKYTTRASNTATATVKLSLTTLGIVVSEATHTITLTCTPDGTIS